MQSTAEGETKNQKKEINSHNSQLTKGIAQPVLSMNAARVSLTNSYVNVTMRRAT